MYAHIYRYQEGYDAASKWRIILRNKPMELSKLCLVDVPSVLVIV